MPTRSRLHGPAVIVAGAALGCAVPAFAGFTNNILVTGYWPPTNEMVRQFSPSPSQNPGGWRGGDWEGRGYDIYSFFPEFPGGVGTNPRGEGDFEVDYQDTSEDWWRITEEIKPVAIITFSRGSAGSNWEIEYRQRNRAVWIGDYDAPFQPTPSPPDGTVPAETIRYSSLPMERIEAAVDAAGLGIDARIDMNSQSMGGGFLSEFMAYHGVWYQSIHGSASDEAWNVAAGHIHVGTTTPLAAATVATEITLRELIDHVDMIVPAPGMGAAAAVWGVAFGVRRRR